MFSGQWSVAAIIDASATPGGDGGGLAALGRARPTADECGDPVRQGLVHDLRADEVDVTVDGAGGDDLAVARDDLGARPDDEVGVDAVHRVGVAGLAQRDDATVADPEVRLDDPPVVEDDDAGDHGVRGALALVARDCPIDSRITLPPPKTASSPASPAHRNGPR